MWQAASERDGVRAWQRAFARSDDARRTGAAGERPGQTSTASAEKTLSTRQASGLEFAGARRSARLVKALALLWLVLAVYPLLPMAEGLRRPADVLRWLPPLAGLALTAGLYVFGVMSAGTAARRRVSWRMYVVLGALGGLACILPFAFGAQWFGGFLYPCLVATLLLRPGRAAACIAGFSALTLLVGAVLGIFWWELVALTLLTGLGGSLMLGLTWLLATTVELAEARTEIARLAAEEERLRLAHDLHDSVKQYVFITAMEIGAARALIGRDVDATAAHLAAASESVHEAQAELTALIHQPDRVSPPEPSLPASLQTYVSEWSRRSRIMAEAHIEAEHVPLRPETQDALFRIAQEALANVARHSQATAAGVVLEAQYGCHTLSIWDNGRGFALDTTLTADAASQGRGYGLRSMRERIEALGGHLTIDSAPGRGTRIICVCPAHGTVKPHGSAHLPG